ncbi:MAG TPA: hypothetical protein DCZ95_05010 [Verrucomicrobia bacterium]|nr:hypothetical protein [Verrucomicrobiota bacterium]
MKELIESIYSHFATGTNSLKTATAGRLEYGKGVDGWTDNFATYQANSANADDAFRTSMDETYWQINLFSSVRETCFDLLSYATSLFDNATLTVTSHYPVLIHKENVVPPIWNEQDNLWQATIEFRCRLQHT